MNKLVLVFGTLFVLVVFLSEEAEGGSFLDNLCEKCDYCKDDPTCSGCVNCSRCEDKKVSQLSIIIIIIIIYHSTSGRLQILSEERDCR